MFIKNYGNPLENDGSNDHIQLDNQISENQIMFDWLDEIFDYNTQLI
jgi:hypothetical protein